jgi:Zn-finger nucleic acid-binding protein
MVQNIKVDICADGCAGMWFDQGELSKCDDPTRIGNHALLGLIRRPDVTVDPGRRRRCPKCPNSLLSRHFFSAKRAVTVDECPTCAGVWLDAGELEQIRSEYPSEEARRHAAHERFEEALIDDRMTLLGEQVQGQLPYDTSRSRIVSSFIVGFYLIVAFKTAGIAAVMIRLSLCVVPWACVWFPEAMGTAISTLVSPTRQSPRSFVWIFGWVALLVPLIQVVILWVEGVNQSPFKP